MSAFGTEPSTVTVSGSNERGADVEFLVKLTGKRPDTLW